MIRMNTVVALVVCVGVTAAPLDANASIRSRARHMSNNAAKLFAEHKYKAAAELFEQAYALDAAKSIRLRNAGRAYEEARLYREALHCFRRYVGRAATPKLREDAKTRIARMEALVVAAQNPTMMSRKDGEPGDQGAAETRHGSSSKTAGTAGAHGASAKMANTNASDVVGSSAASQPSLVLPIAIGATSVLGVVGGGVLLWLASGAASDIDAADARGDYGYSGGSAKRTDDRAAVSLNRGVGWGLVAVGAIGAGASVYLSLSNGGAATVALFPGGPGDGAGMTALVRF